MMAGRTARVRLRFEVGLFSRLFRRVSANIASTRGFAGPPGKRLYAIGDVHGRLDLLDDLLSRIDADLRGAPADSAALVLLGDLIDRGPDSAGVVERVRTLSAPGPGAFAGKVVTLLGNHEEMLLRVLAGQAGMAHDWLGFGGDACAQSYGVDPAPLLALDERRVAEVLGAAIPTAHVRFLKGCGDTVSFGDYLLVHAGIRPGVAVEDQEPRDLRWIREPFLSDAHDHGVMVVHGHTVTDGVEQRVNRLGIDTGAYQTGVLTAAVVEGDALRFLATGS